MEQEKLSAEARYKTEVITGPTAFTNSQLIPYKIMTQKLHVYFQVLLVLEPPSKNKLMANTVLFSNTIKSIIDFLC